jgi:hypothetical protein
MIDLVDTTGRREKWGFLSFNKAVARLISAESKSPGMKRKLPLRIILPAAAAGVLILGAILATNLLRARASSTAVALADLDGDGDLDAFFANTKNESGEPDTVWFNQGSRRWRDSEQRLGQADSLQVALGDLDGDGDPDAWVGNAGFASVFLNDGLGNFSDSGQRLTIEGLGAYYIAPVLGDLDGDGDLDVFAATCCGEIIGGGPDSAGGPDISGEGGAQQTLLAANVVWLNDGQGNFSDSGQRLGSASSQAAALGDLDGDGDLDALVGNDDEFDDSIPDSSGSNEFDTIWLNDGHGNFSDSGQRLGGAGSKSVALGDLDGDGDPDAFLGNVQADEIWLNDGHGNFSDSGQRLGGELTRLAVISDLDGDGGPDIFTFGSQAWRVWWNDGQGDFTYAIRSQLEKNQVVTLGDIDGDGDLDVFAGGLGAKIHTWLNNGVGIFG